MINSLVSRTLKKFEHPINIKETAKNKMLNEALLFSLVRVTKACELVTLIFRSNENTRFALKSFALMFYNLFCILSYFLIEETLFV